MDFNSASPQSFEKRAKAVFESRQAANGSSNAAAVETPEKKPEDNNAGAGMVQNKPASPAIESPEKKEAAQEVSAAQKAAEDAAKEAKAKEQNAEIEAKERQKLLDSSIPEWLKEGKSGAGQGEQKEQKENPAAKEKSNEEIAALKSKVEFFENDPMLSVIADWRKNGGEDLSEFIKEAGMVNVNKLSVEDLYRQKGKQHELSGEDLDEYVSTAVEKFGALNKVEKIEAEKNLKKEIGSTINERAKNLVNKVSQKNYEQIRTVQALQNSAMEELQTKAETLHELNGEIFKPYKEAGLVIDEKLKQAILNDAPNYAHEVIDKQGNLLGYNVDEGLRIATLIHGEKTIMRNLYTKAWTAAAEHFAKERTRVSDNPTSQSPVAQKPDLVAEARKNFNKQMLGKK